MSSKSATRGSSSYPVAEKTHKSEKDDYQMGQNQPILKYDSRVRDIQEENMNEDMQPQRILTEILQVVKESNKILKQKEQEGSQKDGRSRNEKSKRKFEKDDHQMQKNQPILKQDTRVREMQDEIEKLRKENMNKDMQLQRLGRESINYLQATGNSAQAKCQVNARDEFVDLRNRKFLKFIDSLQLDEDTTDSTELLSSFSLKTDSDEVVEIILAESLKVAYDAGIIKIFDLLKKICHQKIYDCTVTDTTTAKENFISALMSKEEQGCTCDSVIEENFSLLYNKREGKAIQFIADFQLFYQSEVTNNTLVKHDTIEEIDQKFRTSVISAFKRFKIDPDKHQEDICKISSNSAEVVWRLITLPDPMLLHLKTTEQLKTEKELYASGKCKVHNESKIRIKASVDCYEIDAYAYPMLINSFEGKIIEKAIVFLRTKK